MKLEKAADKIINKLLDLGFIVHRYDAYSTNSIYIKLDYGACNSIRISDHEGKQHLSYKYNALKGIRKPYWTKDFKNMWRYYCNCKDIDNLINQIRSDRNFKIIQGNYEELKEKFKKENLKYKEFTEIKKEIL